MDDAAGLAAALAAPRPPGIWRWCVDPVAAKLPQLLSGVLCPQRARREGARGGGAGAFPAVAGEEEAAPAPSGPPQRAPHLSEAVLQGERLV